MPPKTESNGGKTLQCCFLDFVCLFIINKSRGWELNTTTAELQRELTDTPRQHPAKRYLRQYKSLKAVFEQDFSDLFKIDSSVITIRPPPSNFAMLSALLSMDTYQAINDRFAAIEQSKEEKAAREWRWAFDSERSKGPVVWTTLNHKKHGKRLCSIVVLVLRMSATRWQPRLSPEVAAIICAYL
jgi:hypothetical protein